MSLRDMVLAHDRDLDDIKAWKNELRGAFQLVKVTLGTSIVSGILAVIALAVLIATAVPKP